MDKPTVTFTERRASHAVPDEQGSQAGHTEPTAAQLEVNTLQHEPEDVSDAEKA